METVIPSEMRVVLLLLKDFSAVQTITSIGKGLCMTRSGVWKVLKRLEREKYVVMRATGKETSAILPKLNFSNGLLDKYLDLALSREAADYERWAFNFEAVKAHASFFILYGSVLKSYEKAKDIDVIGVVHNRKSFKAVHKSIDKMQKSEPKRVHAINFTESEFREELLKPHKAFLDAAKTGVVLFGQDVFVRFMRKMHGA